MERGMNAWPRALALVIMGRGESGLRKVKTDPQVIKRRAAKRKKVSDW